MFGLSRAEDARTVITDLVSHRRYEFIVILAKLGIIPFALVIISFGAVFALMIKRFKEDGYTIQYEPSSPEGAGEVRAVTFEDIVIEANYGY